MRKKQKVYSVDYKFQTSATPTTNMAEIEWNNELWAETSGEPHICIAVLDGPVDRSHASLATANLTNLDTLVAAGADQGPATKHGTHVRSIIFDQHDGSVKGIALSCRGLIVPIFKDGDDGFAQVAAVKTRIGGVSAQYLFTEASGSPTRLEDLDVDLSSFATRTSVSKFRCVASWRRT